MGCWDYICRNKDCAGWSEEHTHNCKYDHEDCIRDDMVCKRETEASDLSESALIDLLSAIDTHVNSGGLLFFWTCPNGCRKGVTWEHTDTHIATCKSCGRSSSRTTE